MEPVAKRAEMSLRLNGDPHSLTIDTRVTLLDLLREQLGLTGSKRGAITASADRARC